MKGIDALFLSNSGHRERKKIKMRDDHSAAGAGAMKPGTGRY